MAYLLTFFNSNIRTLYDRVIGPVSFVSQLGAELLEEGQADMAKPVGIQDP